jgi:hypothetical protein
VGIGRSTDEVEVDVVQEVVVRRVAIVVTVVVAAADLFP